MLILPWPRFSCSLAAFNDLNNFSHFEHFTFPFLPLFFGSITFTTYIFRTSSELGCSAFSWSLLPFRLEMEEYLAILFRELLLLSSFICSWSSTISTIYLKAWSLEINLFLITSSLYKACTLACTSISSFKTYWMNL